MFGKKTVRTMLTLGILTVSSLPAFAQDATVTPTLTPEPLPNCPAFQGESNESRLGYYMGEGLAYMNAGRMGEAEFSFTCVIRVIDTSYVPAYLARAEVYVNLRDYRKAIDDYNAAVMRANDSIIALNNRGVAYAILGDYERAILDFDRVLEIDPEYIAAYNNRSIIHAIQSEFEEALSLIDEGIEVSGAAEALILAQSERPANAAPIVLPNAAVRLYALRGILETAQNLDTFRDYIDLARATGRNPDERVVAAVGSLESRLTFEMRLDDGSWMLRSNFLGES